MNFRPLQAIHFFLIGRVKIQTPNMDRIVNAIYSHNINKKPTCLEIRINLAKFRLSFNRAHQHPLFKGVLNHGIHCRSRINTQLLFEFYQPFIRFIQILA